MDRRKFLRATIASAGLGLVGCSDDVREPARGAATTTPTTPSQTADSTTNSPSGVSRVVVTGDVATDLTVPWGITFLPDGDALVSQRDPGTVLRISGNAVTEVGTVPDVEGQGAVGGEGGLLGLAFSPDSGTLFAYHTTSTDNRIVGMPVSGGKLGDPTVIVSGIAKNTYHDGGGLLIGPDGMLYASTGDAGDMSNSQDRSSLNGKVLRMTLDGDVPDDNPFDNLVWSYGHRNVEGLAFNENGDLWCAEFGQSTYDELNHVQRGRNYGWPETEGSDGPGGFTDPLTQWSTDDCSPSGIAILRDTAFIGALQGECVFSVPLSGPDRGKPTAHFAGEYGRIRSIEVTPDGALWVTTSNTDGRGDPGVGDDRILRVEVS